MRFLLVLLLENFKTFCSSMLRDMEFKLYKKNSKKLVAIFASCFDIVFADPIVCVLTGLRSLWSPAGINRADQLLKEAHS